MFPRHDNKRNIPEENLFWPPDADFEEISLQEMYNGKSFHEIWLLLMNSVYNLDDVYLSSIWVSEKIQFD